MRLDPFKQGEKSEYQEILERDVYYGPKFSEDILTCENNFKPTLHYTEFDDPANMCKLLTYPVKYTIFRPSWLDVEKQIVQYYIEELVVPMENISINRRDCHHFVGISMLLRNLFILPLIEEIITLSILMVL